MQSAPLRRFGEGSMVFFNYATMQMAAKIVYYGPGLCGKTTNLHVIYGRTAPTSRGEMVSPRDRDGPDALLRPPAARRRRHRRLQDPPPALHGSRPGLLQHDAEARPQGRRRHRLRGGLPAPDARAEQREPPEPPREPRRDRPHARERPARPPVQQARPSEHPLRRRAERVAEPGRGRRVVRGVRDERNGRLRDAQGDLEADAALPQVPDDGRAAPADRRRVRRDPGSDPRCGPARPAPRRAHFRNHRRDRVAGRSRERGRSLLLRNATRTTRRSRDSSGSSPSTARASISTRPAPRAPASRRSPRPPPPRPPARVRTRRPSRPPTCPPRTTPVRK